MTASTARRGALALLLAGLVLLPARVDRAGPGGDADGHDRRLRLLPGDRHDHGRRHGHLDEQRSGRAHRDEHDRRVRLRRSRSGRVVQRHVHHAGHVRLPVHAASDDDRPDRRAGRGAGRRPPHPHRPADRCRTSRCRRSGRRTPLILIGMLLVGGAGLAVIARRATRLAAPALADGSRDELVEGGRRQPRRAAGSPRGSRPAGRARRERRRTTEPRRRRPPRASRRTWRRPRQR